MSTQEDEAGGLRIKTSLNCTVKPEEREVALSALAEDPDLVPSTCVSGGLRIDASVRTCIHGVNT